MGGGGENQNEKGQLREGAWQRGPLVPKFLHSVDFILELSYYYRKIFSVACSCMFLGHWKRFRHNFSCSLRQITNTNKIVMWDIANNFICTEWKLEFNSNEANLLTISGALILMYNNRAEGALGWHSRSGIVYILVVGTRFLWPWLGLFRGELKMGAPSQWCQRWKPSIYGGFPKFLAGQIERVPPWHMGRPRARLVWHSG